MKRIHADNSWHFLVFRNSLWTLKGNSILMSEWDVTLNEFLWNSIKLLHNDNDSKKNHLKLLIRTFFNLKIAKLWNILQGCWKICNFGYENFRTARDYFTIEQIWNGGIHLMMAFYQIPLSSPFLFISLLLSISFYHKI